MAFALSRRGAFDELLNASQFEHETTSAEALAPGVPSRERCICPARNRSVTRGEPLRWWHPLARFTTVLLGFVARGEDAQYFSRMYEARRPMRERVHVRQLVTIAFAASKKRTVDSVLFDSIADIAAKTDELNPGV